LGLTALLKQSAADATDNKVPERSYHREKALQRYGTRRRWAHQSRYPCLCIGYSHLLITPPGCVFTCLFRRRPQIEFGDDLYLAETGMMAQSDGEDA